MGIRMLGALALLVLLAAWRALDAGPQPVGADEPAPVAAAPVSEAGEGAAPRPGGLPDVAAAPPRRPRAAPAPREDVRGTVRPRQEARLHTPVEGVLKSLLAVEGERVEAGEPLARMNDEVQASRVAAAREAFESDGDLRRARLRVKEAGRKHERTKRASEAAAAAGWELEQAALELEQARASLQLAQERRARDEKQLRVEESILAQYTLKAPFAGVVAEVLFDEGATLKKSDVLVEIVSLDELEAVLFVPADRFGELRVGESYALQAEPPVAREVQARLLAVDPVLDPASRTFRSLFAIPNPNGKMPAGFGVTLPHR